MFTLFHCRKKVRAFIDSHLKDSPRVTNPVYESPSNGYNNVVFKNDNSPSVKVVKSDDYNHLHDIKNDNSTTTGNTYNHMGQTMGDYNHLHANNNSMHVDERSDAAYNHLPMVKKTHNYSDYNHLNGLKGPDNISEEVANANYSHLGGWTVDYNHLHGGKNEIHEADYKSEISNDDYNHIGGITNENVVDNYHHLGNVNAHVVNGDDDNNIGDTKHRTESA
ncbi:hypothetical protein SNE40_020511 [Patella caerulea]|uniref:Uncharacterized protein n=1 Tax=Patella caerulea TaxID=87958 RepID=A0AAN8J0D0_PATCE